MNFLLHDELLDRIPLRGRRLCKQLQTRANSVKNETANMSDPDISVLIRTRNDMAYIEQLFTDIRSQLYTGAVEIIVIDTASTDGTLEFAMANGARVRSITQEEFTYPHALNLGFEMAKYPYVVTLVGHSNLTSRLMFRSLTLHSSLENFGAMYNLPLPNKNGSKTDIIAAALWPEPIWKRPFRIKKPRGGMLGANSAIVNREVWKKLGGYDERYAGGGEDTALGRSMLERGFVIMSEPLCTVFHSHGLSFGNSLKQFYHWLQISRPKPQIFDTQKVHARRPDLR